MHMKRAGIALLVAGLIALTPGAPALAGDRDDGARTLRATLKGIEEPPSVSSTGRGTFRATISEDGTSLSYTLSYEDLEGDVLQSHIHLGQRGVNGGIAVFLCTNLGNGPEGTPACPGTRAGTVSGMITGDKIVGPSGQGLLPGEFAELLRAIDRSVTYANVHSTKHTGGEIRGQIENED
jgi:CHRD domain-containing protein